jgi:CMP-N-acetylneuraminic acid synthetase
MKFFIIIKQNSERIPHKNFVDLGGKPLWTHLVEELKGEDVFIDTDSQDIINECHSLEWVEAYKRKDNHIKLENDKSFGVSPVLVMIDHFLDDKVFDENEIIVTPHVTSPFIKLKTIKKASEKLKEGYDSVQACVEHKEFCYFRSKPVNFDINVVQKTQDLEPVIMGNGAFFIFTKKTFKKYKNRSGANPYFFPLSKKESIEIDNPEDLETARIFL